MDALNFFGYLKTDKSIEQVLELRDSDTQPRTGFKGFIQLNAKIVEEVVTDFENSKKQWITLDGSDDLRVKHNFMPE